MGRWFPSLQWQSTHEQHSCIRYPSLAFRPLARPSAATHIPLHAANARDAHTDSLRLDSRALWRTVIAAAGLAAGGDCALHMNGALWAFVVGHRAHRAVGNRVWAASHTGDGRYSEGCPIVYEKHPTPGRGCQGPVWPSTSDRAIARRMAVRVWRSGSDMG